MKAERVEPMPILLALFKLAQMPRNGYVFLRLRGNINGKTFRAKHVMCWYHFACWVFYGYTEPRPEYLFKHWDGDTDVDQLLLASQRAIETDQLQIMRVSDYDGRYRSCCYYCNGKTRKGRARAMCGEVPYRNGP